MNYATTGYLFGRLAQAAKDSDHSHHGVAKDLSTTFRALETHFFDRVHPSVDAGIAVGQLRQYQHNGTRLDAFTLHGCRHVSDLIASMDKIALHIDKAFPDHAIDVDEAHVLLCSAHCHDAGNVGGRENHTSRCGEVIEENKKLIPGTERREQVEAVARVHGGRDPEFDRDTFRSLPSDNYQRPRLPLLAAILRMGDELSENPERVPHNIEEFHDISGASTLAYRYAETFRSFRLDRGELFITIKVYPRQHDCTALVANNRTTFYQYLEQRLNKMESEIRYCSQYGRPYLTVRRIRISIEYYDSDVIGRCTWTKGLTLELETGYPRTLPPLATRCEELTDFASLDEYCRRGRQ